MTHLSLFRSIVATGLLWVLMSPVLVATASVSSLAPGVVADTIRLNLSDAIVRSLEASPEMDQREAERRFASARRDEARAHRYLDEMSLSTAHSFAPGLDNVPAGTPENELYLDPDVTNDWTPGALRPFNRFEVMARQPILTWGELSGNIRAARHGVDVEDARVQQKALEVAARTGQIYYNLLLVQSLDRLAQRTRDVIDRAKEEINRLLEEGDESVDQADLFQARLTEEEYRRRVVEIDQNEETARSALRRQLFLPDETTVELADEELRPLDFSIHPDSLDYYIELGLRNRPEIDQAEAGIEAREALVDVARSDYYPKLGFQATLGHSLTLPERPYQRNPFVGDAFRGTSTRTGFGIELDLNFGQTRARVEQAEAELNEVRHQQTAAQQLVRFEVEEAYRDLLVAKEALESHDRATTISGEWLRTEQIDFDFGFGDTENLVKAVRANIEAEAQYFEAVQRYNQAVLRLLRVTGTLADRAQSGTLIDPSSSEE